MQGWRLPPPWWGANPISKAVKKGWKDFRKLHRGPELATLIRAERSLPTPTGPQSVTDDSCLKRPICEQKGRQKGVLPAEGLTHRHRLPPPIPRTCHQHLHAFPRVGQPRPWDPRAGRGSGQAELPRAHSPPRPPSQDQLLCLQEALPGLHTGSGRSCFLSSSRHGQGAAGGPGPIPDSAGQPQSPPLAW